MPLDYLQLHEVIQHRDYKQMSLLHIGQSYEYTDKINQ